MLNFKRFLEEKKTVDLSELIKQYKLTRDEKIYLQITEPLKRILKNLLLNRYSWSPYYEQYKEAFKDAFDYIMVRFAINPDTYDEYKTPNPVTFFAYAIARKMSNYHKRWLKNPLNTSLNIDTITRFGAFDQKLTTSVDDSIEKQELIDSIYMHGMLGLSPQECQIVKLRSEGYKIEEIMEELGITEWSVRNALNKFKQKVLSKYKELPL